jgi:predicted AlkP superfamily pyrophosphatase or phosphodiesterase
LKENDMNFTLRKGQFYCYLTLLFGVFISPTVRELHAERPALVVVVSVDQLTYEYLEKFEKNFAEQGFFTKCRTQGAWFTNCHHRHAATKTGPGHAVQMTGCYPSEHGIIDNDWYDRTTSKSVNCVLDTKAKLIGSNSDDRPASPRNMLSETVGDRLRLATNQRSKVFGVAVKDRSAILMAGHFANAAVWMSNNGEWITCDYYMKELPPYLRTFSNAYQWRTYENSVWELLHPADKYLHGMKEESFGEKPLNSMKADFPHKFDIATSKNLLRQLTCSPFGNEAVLNAASLILEEEQLGRDEYSDILCVSLSSNDYVGHAFGPHSLEVEDMTYRTDLQLAKFYEHVNQHMQGKSWVMLLTADHAVAPIPELVAKLNRWPASRKPYDRSALQTEIELRLRELFSVPESNKQPLIQTIYDTDIYLQRSHESLKGENFQKAQRYVRDMLLEREIISNVVTREQLLSGQVASKIEEQFRKAFHPQRSGDIMFAVQPYYLMDGAAATHGSPWQYDTHVPLLLLAGGEHAQEFMRAGVYHRPVSPAMIAPTLAHWLGVTPPAKCVEDPLSEVFYTE